MVGMAAETEELSIVSRLEERVDDLTAELARAGGPLEGMVGKSAAMQEIFASALKYARRSSPVLVEGEAGSGKTLVGSALHALSPRNRGSLVVLDPESVAGEEFETRLASALERAAGGTLLLDEITAVPPGGQVMLRDGLRRGAAVRFVSTTRRDLQTAVEEGRLRRELAEDLGNCVLTLPPLRARKEDIPLLSDYFLRLLGESDAAGAARIDPRAAEAMMVHDWPGNIRELRTVISRSRALTDGPVIGLAAIQSVLGGASARRETGGFELGRDKEIVLVRVGDSMADVERRLLHRTLEFARGNKKKAAEILKLSLKTIYNKVKEYGLEREFNRRFR
jgi:two-component system response regulator AtoC